MVYIPVHKMTEMLATHPVLLLSSRSGRSNTISTITWYIPLSSDPPVIGISLKPSSMSYHYIRESGDFILAVPNESHLKAIQFCAVQTGRHMDKLYHLNLATSRGKSASPLMLTSCMANIECRVRDIIPTGNRPFITGEVVALTADLRYYDHGWLPHSNLVYYAGGNCYRVGDDIVDMESIRPGYVPPGSFF